MVAAFPKFRTTGLRGCLKTQIMDPFQGIDFFRTLPRVTSDLAALRSDLPWAIMCITFGEKKWIIPGFETASHASGYSMAPLRGSKLLHSSDIDEFINLSIFQFQNTRNVELNITGVMLRKVKC